MQISITGHHIDVTEALRNYVMEKMQRIERHFDKIVNVHVVLEVQKLAQKAEATVQVNGASLFAQEESEDLYAAIDGMVDKLDRQVVKHKEKVQEH
ncbi:MULTISPECIES: ribosome hibernation-promoting factor, HPF/YfiA family [Methylocaldum]|jgi:putative sigma-54 modulation protein|uniref:ribosome hibernation-promoting factor, HPF/YfiA family n=1 Tax=unclassified Methylocaldum TaxID=2622260 RepID=UPI00098A1DAF|nr:MULTISPECIES: ribosome-associated translation inhibitor RaiA [unclassified Methylocaldum]MBP1148905.1 putative sigma-54 modulation protein [Methylocaldum sp. RMAD-M]MVF20628.1 ribosome-associated translation inhibitor RaiA [Methylocaldum sp. BRCS4]